MYGGPSIASSRTATTRRASSTVVMNGNQPTLEVQLGELDQQGVAHRLGADARAVGQEEDRNSSGGGRHRRPTVTLPPSAADSALD